VGRCVDGAVGGSIDHPARSGAKRRGGSLSPLLPSNLHPSVWGEEGAESFLVPNWSPGLREMIGYTTVTMPPSGCRNDRLPSRGRLQPTTP
jgi:hypothetical protein